MFDLGWLELLVIGITALIVVGPKELPQLFRTVGRFFGKVKAMAREFSQSMEDAANESGLKLTDAEIIRTNSTGLAFYNPKNAAEMLKSMKNKNFSREDKIKARLLYEAQSGVVN